MYKFVLLSVAFLASMVVGDNFIIAYRGYSQPLNRNDPKTRKILEDALEFLDARQTVTSIDEAEAITTEDKDYVYYYQFLYRTDDGRTCKATVFGKGVPDWPKVICKT